MDASSSLSDSILLKKGAPWNFQFETLSFYINKINKLENSNFAGKLMSSIL